MACEREMAEIIGPKLQLEPVFCLPALWRHHDTGIIDQEVEARLLISQPLSKCCNGLQTGEIKLLEAHMGMWDLGSDRCDRCSPFFLATACDDDVATSTCQGQRILEA